MKYQVIRQWVSCGVLKEEVWIESESVSKSHYLAHCASRCPITFSQEGDYLPDVFFVRKSE